MPTKTEEKWKRTGSENFASLRVNASWDIPPGLRRRLDRAVSLVLNADYRPISVIPPSELSWQEAFKAVWTGALDVVETYDDVTIRTPTSTLVVPCVLRKRVYVRAVKRNVQFSKTNVFMRDEYRCQYCGRPGTGVDLVESVVQVTGVARDGAGRSTRVRPGKDLTYDHFTARSKGGKTDWHNIVTACGPCNSKKADGSGMLPMKMPRKPTYEELAAFVRRQPITIPSPLWAPYMGWEGPIHVSDPSGDEYALIRQNDMTYVRRPEPAGDIIGY